MGELVVLDHSCDYELHLRDAPIFHMKGPWNIRCISAFSKGFVVGGDNLTIFVYKIVSNNVYEPFKYVHHFPVNRIFLFFFIFKSNLNMKNE